MKKAIMMTAGAALGGIAFLIIAIVVIWLIVSPTLAGLRDVVIIGAGFFIMLFAFLMSAVAMGMLLLIMGLQAELPRVFDKLTAIAESAQGSSDFVTERFISPLIKVSAAASGARAGVQALFGGRKNTLARRETGNANSEEE